MQQNIFQSLSKVNETAVKASYACHSKLHPVQNLSQMGDLLKNV
jgi:hypothetical protein